MGYKTLKSGLRDRDNRPARNAALLNAFRGAGLAGVCHELGLTARRCADEAARLNKPGDLDPAFRIQHMARRRPRHGVARSGASL